MSQTLLHQTHFSTRRIGAEEAREIGVQAYYYFYPLVLMHVSRRVSTNHPLNLKPGLGPEGMFHHIREFSPDGVWMNFETLCSMAWLDLAKGPYVISLPDTLGRYYTLSCFDMWSDIFASLGPRTSGGTPGHFLVTAEGWTGVRPPDLERIEAPTKHVWIVARVATNGPRDYATVHRLQDGFSVTPLSQWGRVGEAPAQRIDPAIDIDTSPRRQVDEMPPPVFYNYAANLMNVDAPHFSDGVILARLRRIGLERHKPFHFKKLAGPVQIGLTAAPEEARRHMTAKAAAIAPITNGWQLNTDTVGSYGNNYLKRAVMAMIGLGAHLTEDCISLLNVNASDGVTPSGKNRYVVHFRRGELPPADAFWAISMYDAEGYPVHNPLSRHTIGDRDSLKYESDGSLFIHIQKDRPADELESNWLPAAEGLMHIVMRLYSPRAEARDGHWIPPVIERVNQ
jgi:hypothetical protein